MEPIAYIRTDFATKFGVPRQAGLIPALRGRVVFTDAYRNPDALRGLEGFSHLWVVWGFSEARTNGFQPTVRPPRLGGNRRLGVFATRSPFRPNPIGLSCVRLCGVETGANGVELAGAGADQMDGTPIYDVKPYLPYDCKPDAVGGFAEEVPPAVAVDFPPALLALLPAQARNAAIGVLAQDPRPKYIHDTRAFGLSFAGFNIRFFADGAGIHVTAVEREEN